MTCPSRNKQDETILVDYCAGELDAVQAAEFEIHVSNCAECAALVSAQKAAWTALDEWAPAEISPDFDARLYARIAREQDQPAWKRTMKRWAATARESFQTPGIWKPVVAGAAACSALAIALAMHVPHASDPARTTDPAHRMDPARAGRIEAVDMDQVEHALDDLDLLDALDCAPELAS